MGGMDDEDEAVTDDTPLPLPLCGLGCSRLLLLHSNRIASHRITVQRIEFLSPLSEQHLVSTASTCICTCSWPWRWRRS